MALGDTETTICNTALFHLGAAPLRDFNNPRTSQEQQTVQQYRVTLNSELRKRAWTFAIARTQFQDAAEDLKGDQFNTWTLPTDCVKLLREHQRKDISFEPKWWLEGRNVCQHNRKAPKLRYITSNVTPDQMDPLFVEAFALRMALRLCEYVTQSSQKKNDLASLYTSVITDAGKQNAWEQPQGTVHAPDESFSWLFERDTYRW